MKILVLGTWHPDKTQEYQVQAEQLGLLLAQRGHTLLASPSSGIQGLVSQAYKKHGGKKFIALYPAIDLMQKVGEKVLIEPDEKIFTDQDYPIRNILQVKEAEGVIVLTGGTGTLAEVLVAVKDYNLPVSYYEGSSKLIDGFLKLDESICEKINCGKEPLTLVKHLEDHCTN